MAFETGTVTDYRDLLAKLKIFVEAEGWTINDYALGATLTDPSKLYVTGPGIVGGQRPNVSILTEANAGTNSYGWRICGHTNYVAALPYAGQANNSPIHYLNLWPNGMDYWFYVNDWRIIVVAKIGTYYMSAYAGFFLPYALPAEYPFPYFIGATFNALLPYNYPNSGMRAFVDPGTYGASYLKRESMEWAQFKNSNNQDNVVDGYSAQDGPMIWPYRNPPAEDDFGAVNEIAWSHFQLQRPLLNGRMPLWQATIIDAFDETIPGVLDGVFATGGFNHAPEQTVVDGADTYRLFINVGRNTPKHYFAILEE